MRLKFYFFFAAFRCRELLRSGANRRFFRFCAFSAFCSFCRLRGLGGLWGLCGFVCLRRLYRLLSFRRCSRNQVSGLRSLLFRKLFLVLMEIEFIQLATPNLVPIYILRRILRHMIPPACPIVFGLTLQILHSYISKASSAGLAQLVERLIRN